MYHLLRKHSLIFPTSSVMDIIVDDGNMTRRATDEELWNTHQVLRCISEQCQQELEALGLDKVDWKPGRSTLLEDVEATATQATHAANLPIQPSAGSRVDPKHARPTQAVTYIIHGCCHPALAHAAVCFGRYISINTSFA